MLALRKGLQPGATRRHPPQLQLQPWTVPHRRQLLLQTGPL